MSALAADGVLKVAGADFVIVTAEDGSVFDESSLEIMRKNVLYIGLLML